MKEKIEYRYEFANGDVVELKIRRSGSAGDDKNDITSEWLEMLLDLDRREYNNNQTETRRHVSLNAMDQDDNQIPTEKDAFEEFYEEETWKEMCKVLTERERLVGDLFFRQGYKQKELAKIFEVNEARMSQIIRKIRKKLENLCKGIKF